ncbi:hypothetical protein JL721_7830 [Aureococcus anophagefferens]|nr:hypothetical protein JL721_7830 [Aureococcus anophagefferens]
MILADGSPALLDWGLAAELDVATRAFLARVVLLLNLRDKRAVREGLVDLECNAKRFTFNAAARDDDPDFVAAFMYQFFDTSAEGVDLDPKLFDRIFYLLQHDPTSFPTLTNCPKEVVLFVRTVSALRRCLRAAGGHRVAASERWAPFARRALGPRAATTEAAAARAQALDACSPCPPSPSGTGGSSPGSRDTTTRTWRSRGSRTRSTRAVARGRGAPARAPTREAPTAAASLARGTGNFARSKTRP